MVAIRRSTVNSHSSSISRVAMSEAIAFALDVLFIAIAVAVAAAVRGVEVKKPGFAVIAANEAVECSKSMRPLTALKLPRPVSPPPPPLLL